MSQQFSHIQTVWSIVVYMLPKQRYVRAIGRVDVRGYLDYNPIVVPTTLKLCPHIVVSLLPKVESLIRKLEKDLPVPGDSRCCISLHFLKERSRIRCTR